MALYRLVKHALPELAMIEYSRFTRRIKQLGSVLQAIRQGFIILDKSRINRHH